MTTLTFDTLFSPYGGNCFTEEIMGQAALYVAGAPGKLDHLFSWADLNHQLEFGGLSFPRLRLIRGGEELPEGIYLRAGRSGYQRPLVRELTAQLSAGAMLAIQSIEELHEPISMLCEMLEHWLAPSSTANEESCASRTARAKRISWERWAWL